MVTVECETTEDMTAREVVDEGLEVLEDGSTWGLIDIEVKLGVGEEEECSEEVEQQRVVVELVVGGAYDTCKHQCCPYHALGVGEEEDEEEETFEVQLLVGLDAQRVGHCQQHVAHHCCHPVQHPTLLGT